jgi:hypothetical protein
MSLGGHAGGGFEVPLGALLLALMGPLQLSHSADLLCQGCEGRARRHAGTRLMLDVVLNPLWTWIIVGEVPGTARPISAAPSSSAQC